MRYFQGKWRKIIFCKIFHLSKVPRRLIILLFNLRKEAHIHKMINTVTAIKSVENLTMIISWILPGLRCNTRVTAIDREDMLNDQVEGRDK